MATIVSAATGNFNSAATWVGGVVPGPADIAQVANTHVVTITANTTCTAIECLNTTGYFLINDGVTLTAEVRGGSTGGTLQYSGTGSATISGNITLTQAITNARVVVFNSTGTLNITGTVGATVNATSSIVIQLQTGCKVNLTGSVSLSTRTVGGIGNSGSNDVSVSISGSVTAGASWGIWINSGTVYIGGSLTAGTSSNSWGVNTSSTTINSSITVVGAVSASTGASGSDGIRISRGTVTVSGNVTGGSSAYGITSTAAQDANTTITVNGNVYPGTNQHGIFTGAYLVVNGDCYGSDSAKQYGVYLTGTPSGSSNSGRAKITGNIYAGLVAPAIFSNAGSAVILTGNIVEAANGRVAVADCILRILNTATHSTSTRTGDLVYVSTVLQNGTQVTLVRNDLTHGPAASNVRSGVTYAAGTVTGTMAVPPTKSVRAGVAVDNIVGTGALSSTDISNVLSAQLAAATTSP